MMAAPGSWRVSTNRIASTYVCPSCQHARVRAANRTALNPTSIRGHTTGQKTRQGSPTAVQRRTFSQSVRLRATPQSDVHLSNDVPEYNFALKGPKASKSSIRESLKAWSEQNELNKILNAPADLPVGGRITQLPNNLFLRNRDAEEVDTDYSHAFEDDIEGVESTFMSPGSLFSHGKGFEDRQFAIYLGNLGIQGLLVLESGKWTVERMPHARKHDSGQRRAVIPDFLSQHEIEQLRAHLPRESVTRPIGDGLIRQDTDVSGTLEPSVFNIYRYKLKNFEKDMQAFDRTHRAQIEAVYDRLAHETEWRFIPIERYVKEATGMEYSKLPPAAKMAVIALLTDHDHVRTMSAAETMAVMCCSKETVRDAHKVLKWAREYQDAAAQAALGKDVSSLLRNNPLTAFIDKSRRIVLKSRKLRAPTITGCLGPSIVPRTDTHIPLLKVHTDEEFTEQDVSIIRFIWNATFRRPNALWNGPWKTLPITALILRAVGAYPSLELDAKSGRLFLKEIGAVDPWASHYTQDVSLPLASVRGADETNRLRDEMLVYAKTFEQKVDAGKMFEMDTMAHLRKDWGSLKAMTIDPATAQVAEDAISIEPAKELPGGYWIHVHASHPTAFLERDNIISRYLRHQGTACYTVDNSLPTGMAPKGVSSSFHMRPGAPVLTMSTLLTGDGRVHQRKIAAGIIHNIIKIDRLALDDVLGIERDEEETAIIVVGKVPWVKATPLEQSSIDQAMQHKEELRLIRRLLDARWKQRKTEMSEEIVIPRYDFGSMVITTNVDRTSRADRELQSYHWQGDPGIVLRGKRTIKRETSDKNRTDDIVTQAMRLAAETTGAWLAERKIPVVFLTTQASPGNSFEKLRKSKPGSRIVVPMFVRSSTPAPFYNLNIKSYSLCTSPIRRFIDMIVHFQIDSYLKAEAKGLVHSGAPIEDESLLAFTKSEVDEYLKKDSSSADKIELAVRAGKLDHAFQAMFRAFHFKEAELPPVWEVMIDEPAKSDINGRSILAEASLIPFGLKCTVKKSPDGWDKQAGYKQYLPVKIEVVDPDQHMVLVNAVGPPTNNQTMTDPIQAWSEANIDERSRVKSAPI